MKVERFSTINVSVDGKVKDGGAVEVEPFIKTSALTGGCGLGHCNCSPGFWLSFSAGRQDDGTVDGLKFSFKDREEMDAWLAMAGLKQVE